MRLFFLLLVSLVIHISSASAYFTTAESGEVIAPGTYQAGFGPQFSWGPSEANLAGHFDVGINDSSSFRATMGFGGTDFQVGGYYKLIPFPDYGNQPALGFKAGINYARYDSESTLSIRVHPIASKKYSTDYGLFVPYASLPFGITSIKSKTITPIQFTLGSEFKSNEVEKMTFGAELSLELSDSFSYIFAYVNIPFDDVKGF